MTIGGTLGLDAGDMVYNTIGDATATISITAAGDDLLKGTVNGHVIVTDTGYQERREAFTAAFTVVVPSDYTAPPPGPYGAAYRCTIP